MPGTHGDNPQRLALLREGDALLSVLGAFAGGDPAADLVAFRWGLVASGVNYRTLDVPGIERWHGAGVFYGTAHTEAANLVDQNVIVVGAANSAAHVSMRL